MRAERDAGGVITTTMMAKNKKKRGIRTVVNNLMTAGFSNDCARFTGNAAGRGRGGRSLILACRLLCRESGGEWHVLESGRGEGDVLTGVRLVLRAPGRLKGDVVSPELVVEPGATILGQIHIAQQEAEATVAPEDVAPVCPREAVAPLCLLLCWGNDREVRS